MEINKYLFKNLYNKTVFHVLYCFCKTKEILGVQGYALATTNKPQGLSSVLDFACSVDTLDKVDECRTYAFGNEEILQGSTKSITNGTAFVVRLNYRLSGKTRKAKV